MLKKLLIAAAFILILTLGYALLNQVGKQLIKPDNSKLGTPIECRSPELEICKQCLEVTESGCNIKEWTGGYENTQTAPWYNASKTADCNQDIPKCAKCTNRDYDELTEINNNPNFNASSCDKIDLDNIVDPCFIPNSNECLCKKRIDLAKKCYDTKDTN